jgi:hypothetical protein
VGRRVEIPLAVLGLLVLALLVLTTQGLRMARDRHARLLPSRATLWLTAEPRERVFDLAGRPRFLVVDLGEEAAQTPRVGLYQSFPERTLVRWIEPVSASPSRWLVIPLEGLQAGEYLLTREATDAAARPREMDLPAEQPAVIGRFRLDSR